MPKYDGKCGTGYYVKQQFVMLQDWFVKRNLGDYLDSYDQNFIVFFYHTRPA